MMASIFEDKTTFEDGMAQWSQRPALSMYEPQNKLRPLPGFRISHEADVKSVERPRKGHDY